MIQGKLDILVVGGGMYVCGRGFDNNYGTIGPALLEAIRNELVESIHVVTTNSQSLEIAVSRLNEVAGKMGVDAQVSGTSLSTASLKEVIEKVSPDAAIISVPDHLHAELTCEIAKNKIPCLVVKPMAPTSGDAHKMVEAVEDTQTYGAVEFHKRYDEANILMADSIANGEIGDPLYAVIEYSQQKKIPRDVFKDWADKTSIFQYLGVHYVDLIQYVTGFVPLAVTCWGQKSYLYELGIDTYDSMQTVIEWQKPDGGVFVSTHMTNWIDPDCSSAISDQKINIVGTLGRYQSDQKNRGVQKVGDKFGINDVNPYFSTVYSTSDNKNIRYKGYGITSILQFVQDVRSLHDAEISLEQLIDLRPSFQQCQLSSAVIEAAHQSLEKNNAKVRIAS